MVVELAVQTGIPPSVWAEEGEQAIITALELIEEAKRAAQKQWDRAFS